MTDNYKNNSPSAILLDEYTKEKISSAAHVAGIAAIISIAGTVLSCVAYFLNPAGATTAVAKEGFDKNAAQLANGASLLSVIISIAINGILFYFLYRFSILIKKALQSNDRIQLERGLISVARYFKVWGVIMLFIVGLMVLVIISTGFGAAIK